MELRNKNSNIKIITDQDILLTGELAGRTLSDEIRERDSEIEELKSNVKWLYKYGGTGSGSGGSGSSSPLAFSAKIGTTEIDLDTFVDLSDYSESSDISITILKPSQLIYYVDIYYGNRNILSTLLVTTNGRTLKFSHKFDKNLSLTIEVSDGETTCLKTATILVMNYQFDLKVTTSDKVPYLNLNPVGLDYLRNRGMELCLEYNFYKKDYTNLKYSIIVDGDEKVEGDLVPDTLQTVNFNLSEIFLDPNYSEEILYASHKILVIVCIDGKYIEFPFEFVILSGELQIIVSSRSQKYLDKKEPNIQNLSESQIYLQLLIYPVVTTYYQQSNLSKNITITASVVDGELTLSETSITSIPLNTSKSIKVKLPDTNTEDPKVIKLTFRIDDTSVEYYIVLKNIAANIGYYPDRGNNVGYSYIEQDYDINVREPQEIEITDGSGNALSSILNIGFLYYFLSDFEEPVMSMYFNRNTGNKLILYQLRGEFSISGVNTENFSIYIPLEDISQKTAKWHSLSIISSVVSSNLGIRSYNYYIYIDGCLESILKSVGQNIIVNPTININAKSYIKINKILLGTFSKNINNDTIPSWGELFNDYDVYLFWVKYNYTHNSIDLTGNLISVQNLLNAMDWDSDKNVFKYNGDYSDIIGLPVLELTVATNVNNDLPFFEWLHLLLDTQNATVSASVRYRSNISGHFQSGDRIGGFKIKKLGTSSLENKAKNFELIYDEVKEYSFSPNFNPNDPTTFLPEQSFNLKADVVDSSHSNNTAIGKFINANTNRLSPDKGMYSGHVKNCLDGFPVYLFISIGNNEIYYLGIYNFNLTRSSKHNLGYTLILLINEKKNLAGIGIYEVIHDQYENFISAEVLEKSPVFDFSQYDRSVLFSLESNTSTVRMFGDFIIGSGPTDNLKDTYIARILNFVKDTAFAGGYAFQAIGKTFNTNENENYGYNSGYNVEDITQYKNIVPNYRYQCILNSNGVIESFREGTDSANKSHLIRYILGNEENSENAIIDFNSLLEYYVICMAFGLVDSVLKNLTIKSWDENSPFKIAFYDMDTALGIDNLGNAVDYFAFSDYWYQEESDLGDNTRLSPAYIYRDVSQAGAPSYDTPSSYLFAIAKYAAVIFLKAGLNSPCDIWAKFRKVGGPLENADKFIDTYFQLQQVPEVLQSLNYRYKYITTLTPNYKTDEERSKCKGKRINVIRDWLSNRLHILDAYFNLSSVNSFIQKYDEEEEKWVNTIIPEPTLTKYSDVKDEDLYKNEDIIIKLDIFSLPGKSSNYTTMIKSKVKSKSLTPLVYKIGELSLVRYLLYPNIQYQYDTWIRGSMITLFGGTPYVSEISNLDDYIDTQSKLQLSSKFLSKLNIDGDNKLSELTLLSLPSLEEINILGRNYTCGLTLDNVEENYPILNKIKLLNMGGNITITRANLEELELSNLGQFSSSSSNLLLNAVTVKTNTIKLDTSKFKKVGYSEVNLNELGTLEFTNCEIEEITIDVTNASKIQIKGCTKLTKVTIKNCDNVTNIDLSGLSTLETLILLDVNINLQKLDLSGTKVKSISKENTALLDLSNFGSLTLNIKNNTEVTSIIGNNTILLTGACSGCTKLVTIQGSFTIQGNSVFNGCKQLSLTGYNNDLITFDNTTDISRCFEDTALSIDNMEYIMSRIHENIQNISYLFAKNVNYPNEVSNEQISTRWVISNELFEKCTNVSNLENLFYGKCKQIEIPNSDCLTLLKNVQNFKLDTGEYDEYIIPRDLFLLTNDISFKMTTLSLGKVTFSNNGNIYNLLSGCTKLTTIDRFLFNCDGTLDFEQFDGSDDRQLIPSSVIKISSSFNFSNGTGVLTSLDNLFKSPSTIQYIDNSFTINKGNAVWEVNNLTFKSFSNLLSFGGINPLNNGTGIPYYYLKASFTGNGIIKLANELPTNILDNCPNSLKTFLGFFNNIEISSVDDSFTIDVKEIFLNNSGNPRKPLLENIAALFAGCNYKLKLLPGIFKGYNNLLIVYGLFSNCKLLSIPPKLFYTKHTTKTLSRTVRTGENGEEQIIYITMITPEPTITNISSCFANTPLTYYENDSLSNWNDAILFNLFGDTNNIDFIATEGYTHYKNAGNKWVEILDINRVQWLDKWDEDGNKDDITPINVPTLGILDTTFQSIKYYFCPPDVFRYCKNNCTISHCFKGNFIANSTNVGGRIPSILLLPVISGLKYLVSLFLDRVGFSAWKEEENGPIYVIPKDLFKGALVIQSLKYCFQRLHVPIGTDLCVFDPLSRANAQLLEIDYIFHYLVYGGNIHNENQTKGSIEGVFANLSNIISANYAFSLGIMENGSITVRYANKPNVTFSYNFHPNLRNYTTIYGVYAGYSSLVDIKDNLNLGGQYYNFLKGQINGQTN